MVSTRWDVLLGELGVVATQIAQAAPGVYPLSAPRLGAHEESIDTAEERLGHPLDAGFRELLRHADGWPGAFFDGDVLGTRDLGTGPLWERGSLALDQFYEYGPVDGLPARDRLYPIFVAPHQQDVMALRLDGPGGAGGRGTGRAAPPRGRVSRPGPWPRRTGSRRAARTRRPPRAAPRATPSRRSGRAPSPGSRRRRGSSTAGAR